MSGLHSLYNAILVFLKIVVVVVVVVLIDVFAVGFVFSSADGLILRFVKENVESTIKIGIKQLQSHFSN